MTNDWLANVHLSLPATSSFLEMMLCLSVQGINLCVQAGLQNYRNERALNEALSAKQTLKAADNSVSELIL